MLRIPAPIPRRRFLAMLGSGAVALVVAACTRRPASSPTSSLPPPTPTPTPTPALTPTLAPSEAPSQAPAPTLREKIGQMLLVGFRGLTVAQAATAVADIRERNLGGVLLYDQDLPTGSAVRNIESPSQLAALVAGLQRAAATPLIVAVDEEGGEVARLGPAHGFPATYSAAELGARNDPAFTQQQGRAIATTLKAAGINLNLAPVVDLDVNPDNPIIGALDRSFGADPALVTTQAEAFIAGHHAIGTLTTLKHFPGHGSSTGDTHLGVVDVTNTWSSVELKPFANVIADGLADAVLTAHVFNRNLDAQHPATLSKPIITGILRNQLGWDGLVISDDMQMGAIRAAYGYTDALRLAITAGVDVLTIAQQQVFEPGIVATTIDAIAALVAEGSIPAARIDEAYARIVAFKQRFGATT
jgi:beta-N-acetylhexosaminidase